MVRASSLAFELAFVLANLAFDICDAKIDRAVPVLGRLVTRYRESVVVLKADVNAVIVALCTEDYVTSDRIWKVLANSFHSLFGVRLQGIGRFHMAERHRELHRAPPTWFAFDDTSVISDDQPDPRREFSEGR